MALFSNAPKYLIRELLSTDCPVVTHRAAEVLRAYPECGSGNGVVVDQKVPQDVRVISLYARAIMGELSPRGGRFPKKPNLDVRSGLRKVVRKLENLSNQLVRATENLHAHAKEVEELSDVVSPKHRTPRPKRSPVAGGVPPPPVVSKVKSVSKDKRHHWVEIDSHPPVEMPIVLAMALMALAEDDFLPLPSDDATDKLVRFKSMQELREFCKRARLECSTHAMVQRISRLRSFLRTTPINLDLIESDNRGGYRLRVERARRAGEKHDG